MNNSPNIKQVETVLKYIKNELYSGRLQPGERLPAERRLADMLGVGRAHVRAAFQKLEFYGIVQTFPQSGTVVAQEKMQVLERMITDALQIRQYDFASLVYVRVLLEIEAIKLCARNRTAEDLENIERALEECEAKFYTEERVSKDFAYHQALARGAAQLAAVELRAPKSLLGRTTAEAMQAGIVMGEVARIDGLIDMIWADCGYTTPVVLVGQHAEAIAALMTHAVTVDQTLALRGLLELYAANTRR